MGISIWQVIILGGLVGIVVIGIWLNIRILNKAGYSGWWSAILFIPFVNIVMIWVFAFSKWPSLNGMSNSKVKIGNIDQLQKVPSPVVNESQNIELNKTNTPVSKFIFPILAGVCVLVVVVMASIYLNNPTEENVKNVALTSSELEASFSNTDFNILKKTLFGHWIRIDGRSNDSHQYFSETHRSWVEGDSKGSAKYAIAKANYPSNWVGIDLNDSGEVSTIVQFSGDGRKMRMITFFNFGKDSELANGPTGLSSDWVKVDNKTMP